jgi:hypothetical protein
MSEWRPIETAPLNPSGRQLGPGILVWFDYSHEIVEAHWVGTGMSGHWARKSGGTMPTHYVTHWMPLPPPPQEPTNAD